ncbi:MAG: methyl-accepting chemotaxis protein [Burkholderiales bacterium]
MERRNRIPVGLKLVLSFGFMLLALVAVSVLAWTTLDRIERAAQRVTERYVAQLTRISDAQSLMLRMSLEARHAMLETEPAARRATVARIVEARTRQLELLDEFEKAISTDRGRQMFASIREADARFWKPATEVVGKIEAGRVDEAFAQLKTELVPARDAMVTRIAEQREWQTQLMVNAVREARAAADTTKTVLIATVAAAVAIALWAGVSITRMLRGAFRRAIGVTQSIATGNLADEVYVRQGDEFGHLFSAIVDMQSRLNGVVANVRTVADEIARTAQEIDAANAALAAETQAQADSVGATTASTTRMTESVRSSAQSTESVGRLAGEASKAASSGGDVVGQVVDTMKAIDASSQRIADIVSVIDGIAFQTNILALNAAVEAARAGEQGRGFAVVASEVRSLAHRSASAAKEVKALIGESVERVRSGSALADDAGRTMRELVGSVHEVTTLMGGLATSIRAQAEDVETVHRSVQQIDDAARRNASVVERSNTASAELRRQAAALEEAVRAFNLERVG